MAFKMTVETENAAFADGHRRQELADILRRVAVFIEAEYDAGTIYDSNGNAVGTFATEAE